MLRRVVTGKVDTDIVAKYTVLAGSFCILKYVENCRGSNFSVKSIRYDWRDCAKFLFSKSPITEWSSREAAPVECK